MSPRSPDAESEAAIDSNRWYAERHAKDRAGDGWRAAGVSSLLSLHEPERAIKVSGASPWAAILPCMGRSLASGFGSKGSHRRNRDLTAAG